MADERSPAREAAAAAAAELVQPRTAIGLGSGRALWRTLELIAERGLEDLSVVAASEDTRTRALDAGIEVVELDGSFELDIALDGADELDAELRLIKGGGGALLREKIVVAAAARFVVVAETKKRVDRLGEGFRLPVEVVRFASADTRRRLARLLPDAELREGDDGKPYVTDEGHLILDCAIPAAADLDGLGPELHAVPGVVEHGLFIGMAERALLGTPEGRVEVLEGN